MLGKAFPAFEVFLVEDVILTLGNLRGSLVWLGQTDPVTHQGLHKAGLERIDRQIEGLVERARRVCSELAGKETKVEPPKTEPSNNLQQLLRDVLGSDTFDLHSSTDQRQPSPMFLSRRAKRS